VRTLTPGGSSASRQGGPRPSLSVSAHWYVPEAGVTVTTAPRTVHDFGGFPPVLYEVQYPAPGDPELVRRVQQRLAPLEVKLDNCWGLDHGTWSVLRRVYPAADIPIMQLSIDETKPASFHFEIGKKLAPLRDEGVLIVGSGNLVHNLHTHAWGRHPSDPYDWAVRFESAARVTMLAGDYKPLVNYDRLGRDAALSIPTPGNYLPLLDSRSPLPIEEPSVSSGTKTSKGIRMDKPRDVAVIVGSLRKDSINRKVANALAELTPAGLKLGFVEIGQLPIYNQDGDNDPPAEWTAFRERIRAADAVLFVTPEHNRSVPAALKNALDVGSRPYGKSAWSGKPGAVVSASPGGTGGFGANHHLRQSLVFLNVPAMAQPEAYIGGADKLFDASGKLVNDGTRKFLRDFMLAYAAWVSANVPHRG